MYVWIQVGGGYKFNNFRILLDSEFSSIELIAM